MNKTPLIFAIDTREQIPWSFARSQRVTMPTGDYSIVGYEHRICVERKTQQDMWGTCGRGHKRFSAELERMAKMEMAWVMIECTQLHFAVNPPIHVRGSSEKRNKRAQSYVKMINSWMVKHGVPVLWWDNRAVANRNCEHLLVQWVGYHGRTEQ